MDINDFQKQALNTVAITDKNIQALSHRGFGLTGEAGRVAEILKKIIRDKDGNPDHQDIQDIKKRLGDVLYYTATLADFFNLELKDVAEQNIEQSNEFKKNRQQANQLTK
jgi:NTP pyrophosphatase (non-canonical NTP hydrolase)